MANTIQINRSAADTAPTGLAKGELSWVDHGTGGANGKLYIGDMTSGGAVRRHIGGVGDGAVDSYTHPTHDGDDISLDTGALAGATVISDLDFNVTTDTSGHVTDANAAVSTRDLTLANLGYTGATDANNYVLPTNLAGDDISVDTGALTGATVVSDIDINITTNTSGLVTDANGAISTRTLTLGNLGYTGETDATADQTADEIGVLFAADDTTLQLGGALIEDGDLTVSGTTTTVDTTTLSITDPLMLLSSGASGAPSVDSGFLVNRGSSDNAALVWDESQDKFGFMTTDDDGTTAGNLTAVAWADIKCGDIASDEIVADNINATGDVSTGDKAAMGFTAAEGLVLTGQGTTNDITLKNDNDGDVMTVATGTTDVTFPGSIDVTGSYNLASGDIPNNAADTTGNASTVTNGVYTSGNITQLAASSSANFASVCSDETGSGSLVFATSPTLVTPALGTPSALVGTNISGTASSLTAGNVTTNANLTGHVTSVGNAAVLGSFTVAQLSTALSDASISGNNTGDQTLRTDAEVEDLAGGLFSGNTETGITATYQEADNTVDLVVTNATALGNLSGTNTGDNTVATALTGTPDITVGTVVADAVTLGDNEALQLGTNTDGYVVHASAALGADAETPDWVEGTSDHLGYAANSMVISNITNDGDIAFYVSDGGNSKGVLLLNGDDGNIYTGGGADIKGEGVATSSITDFTIDGGTF